MSMTRKDYQAIAAAIKAAMPTAGMGGFISGSVVVQRIAYDIALHCAKDNPRFDLAKFLEECGVPR